MAARSLLLGALALACVAKFIQISSASCIRKSESSASCSSYSPESYFSRCSCVSKPVEPKEFHVYSGIHSNPNAPCKAHYYNLEEPPQKEEEPCVALGYGLQVPSRRSDPVQCSSHSYKVETIEPAKKPLSYAYGYLVTEPKIPETPCRIGSVGYQVETPAQPVPEKSSAYGYAVAVPKPPKNPCISQSYNYQVEAPPPPPKEDRYAYGIAVQAFPEPAPCVPCVDDYEFPDIPPPPMPKPCVPCEDDYVFPKPEVSVSVREKSYSSSECPCKNDGYQSDEDNTSGEDNTSDEDSTSGEDHTCDEGDRSYENSGNDCGQRYEREVQRSYEVSDGEATSYEDDSPPAWRCSRVSQAERSTADYRGVSSVWRGSSVEDTGEDLAYGEDVREGVSDDSAGSGQQADLLTNYGSTFYDASSHLTPSSYNTVFSKVRGWGEHADESKEIGFGGSDSQGYGVRYSSGNSQGYLSVDSGSYDSKEEGTEYDSKTVQSSLAPVSYDEDKGCEGGSGFRAGNFNTPVLFSSVKYDESRDKEDSSIEYGDSSYSASNLPCGSDAPDSYEQGDKVSSTFNGDSYAGDKYSSGSASNYYGNNGGYEQEDSGSDTYVQPVSTYISTHSQRDYQHENNYDGKSASIVYSSNDPFSNSHSDREKSYSVAEQPTKYYFEKFEEPVSRENEGVNSISYGEVGSQNPICSSSNYENLGDFQKQDDDIYANSYASKSSYTPVACASCSALRRKYDGGLNNYNGDSNSYDGDNVYTSSDYHTSPIKPPWTETSVYNSYYPFPLATHYPRQEHLGVVGHNLYKEIQTDDHFSGTFAHGNNVYNNGGNSIVGHDKEYLSDGGNMDGISYSKAKYGDFAAEGGLSEVESSKDQSHKVLKKVVVESEEPNVEEENKVIIEEKGLVKGISQEIIKEDVTEYVPEKETEVTEKKFIGSNEKYVKGDSEGYVDEPADIEKIFIKKTFSGTDGTTSEGNPNDAIYEAQERNNEAEESVSHYEADKESINQNNEKSEKYELVEKVIEKDGDVLEKEEISVVKTYGKDSDRVVIVGEDSEKEAEVIVEGNPKVVYEKSIIVKESDEHGGKKLVSKEVIETVRPAVAVEITVSEPHHKKEVTHTYKKTHSTESKPSKHSSEKITEIINEYVVSGEHKGKKSTKVYSGERYGGDEVSETRTRKLEKVLTEDPEEAVEYVIPSRGSGGKSKSVVKVHKGSSVEIIATGSGSKEKVHSVSYEANSLHPGTKKTVLVTKTTSSEHVTPRYDEGDEQPSHGYGGTTVKEYIEKKYEPDVIERYEEVTENSDPEYQKDSGNDDGESQAEEVSADKITNNVPKTYSSSYERHVTTSYERVPEKKASTKHTTVTKTYVDDYSVPEEPKVAIKVYSSSGDEGSSDVGSIQKTYDYTPSTPPADYTPSTRHPVDFRHKYSTRGDITSSNYHEGSNVGSIQQSYDSESVDDSPSTRYPVDARHKYSTRGDVTSSNYHEGSNVGSIQQSYDSESVDDSPSTRYPVDARYKYTTGGKVTASSDSKPYHSRELYTESDVESFSPSRPKFVNEQHGETYSPENYNSYDGSSEQVYYDGYNAPRGGFIRVPQKSGYWHSRSESRSQSQAVNSHKSAYRAVEVRGGGSSNYYGDQDDGRGSLYQSYPSGGTEEQTYDSYNSFPGGHGTKYSLGSLSDSYGTRGVASKVAFGDQGSIEGYGNGRVKSFVIREARENTKKSSGFHRHQQHVSSSGGGSGVYSSRSSSESQS